MNSPTAILQDAIEVAALSGAHLIKVASAVDQAMKADPAKLQVADLWVASLLGNNGRRLAQTVSVKSS